jgi:hypothetical protein
MATSADTLPSQLPADISPSQQPSSIIMSPATTGAPTRLSNLQNDSTPRAPESQHPLGPATPPASLADPWYVEGETPHQLPRSNFMPMYDPLDWPEVTEASNDLQSHQPDSTSSDLDIDPFSLYLPQTTAPVSNSLRPSRTRQPPQWMKEYFMGTLALPSEPTCYSEAASSA